MILNDLTASKLRSRVERAVRPIRATETRKDRMREELYAHLVSAYEEEVSKSAASETKGEPSCGPLFEERLIERAFERFGDPDELRRFLQDSVPPVERSLFIQLPWIERVERWAERSLARGPGESALRWAARRSFPLTAFIAFFVFIVNPALKIVLRPSPDLAKVYMLGGITFILFSVCTFVYFLLYDGFETSFGVNATKSASRGRAVAYAAATGFVVLFAGLAFAFGSRRYLTYDSGDLAWLLLASLLTPFVVAFCAYATHIERKRRREWKCEGTLNGFEFSWKDKGSREGISDHDSQMG